jgi:hypothetical protein
MWQFAIARQKVHTASMIVAVIMVHLAQCTRPTAGYERSTGAGSKMKEMRTESKYVMTPRNVIGIGQLPSPAASVCSHTGNAGAVWLDPSLQCLTCKVDSGEIDTGERVRSAVVKLDSHCLDFVRLCFQCKG